MPGRPDAHEEAGQVTGVDRTAAHSVLQMWKGGRARSVDNLNGSTNSDTGASSKALQKVEAGIEKVTSRVTYLEGRTEKQGQHIDDARERLQAVERENTQLRREIEAAGKQIEAGAIALDRERGRVLDLHEQLRYLTAQITQWHNEQLTPAQASYWALLGWVYIPLLYVVRGLWVLLYPIISTFQHMSLFGYSSDEDESLLGSRHGERSTDLGTSTGSNPNARGPSHRPGSLLERLKDGAINGADKLNAAALQRRSKASTPRTARPPVVPTPPAPGFLGQAKAPHRSTSPTPQDTPMPPEQPSDSTLPFASQSLPSPAVFLGPPQDDGRKEKTQ